MREQGGQWTRDCTLAIPEPCVWKPKDVAALLPGFVPPTTIRLSRQPPGKDQIHKHEAPVGPRRGSGHCTSLQYYCFIVI